MSKVPCGRPIHHGDNCSDARICDSCREIIDLRVKVYNLENPVPPSNGPPAPSWEMVESGQIALDHAWATHRLAVPGGWLYRFTCLFISQHIEVAGASDLKLTKEIPPSRADRESMVFVPHPSHERDNSEAPGGGLRGDL